MKGQHRHELQTNFLADRVGRFLEAMKSGGRSNKSLLAWVFVLLTVGTYAIWQYTATAGQNERSEQWLELSTSLRDLSGGEKSLATLADSATGTIPGRTARFEVARMELQLGQQNLRSAVNRTDAVKNIQLAQKRYDELSKICVDNPLLTQEALMGVASAEESLIGVPDPDQPDKICGSLDRAVQYYQRLVKDFPESPLGKAAAKRIEDITANRQKVEEFYAKLNEMSGSKPKLDLDRPSDLKAKDEKKKP
jgi:hypothetical protein